MATTCLIATERDSDCPDANRELLSPRSIGVIDEWQAQSLTGHRKVGSETVLRRDIRPTRGQVPSRAKHYERSILGRSKAPAGGVPYGIRTRVAAVKGRCPRPLDEGD
jgi:hypothetical protein